MFNWHFLRVSVTIGFWLGIWEIVVAILKQDLSGFIERIGFASVNLWALLYAKNKIEN